MLNNYLQDKRYLVVLDDLWKIETWESVIHALPRHNCGGGRVIITTTRGDIAYSCRQVYVDVYIVRALPLEKARELFYKTAFHENGMSTLAQIPRVSSEKLLNECEGLPLAIITVGKVLSKEKSEFEFQKLHDSIQAELDSGRLSSIKQVLLLSYDELPHHLKHCFLYTSMFPQNYFLKRRTLIRLWIAEGFVKGVAGKKLEDVGEEYLKEIMDRNLIQTSELDFDGKPRNCRLHNIVHKIALSISEAESFCIVKKDLIGDISAKARRLSIQSSEFNISNNIIWHACTLLITSCINVKISPQIGSSLKLLKILHLEGANVDTFPPGISDLLLLKYLCLSNTRIKQIPKTIGRLRLLETLNLKQTLVRELPHTMGELGNLRDLLVYCYNINCYVGFDAVQGFKAPSDIRKLSNLQKLSFVRADGNHKLIRELRNLTELRKLGIIDLPSKSGPFLCETIEMLTNLHSLNMTSLDKNEILEIQEINSPPPFLERLYLKGKLEKMPHWISKLHDLVRLRLKWSKLTHDNNPIKVVEKLPNLLELQLLDAYSGDQLDFGAGTFLNLKILEFTEMEKLETIMINNGALPCLEKLIISQCQRLKQIPAGIVNVTKLKELHLSDLPGYFVDPLRRNGRMRHLVQHIQNIYSKHLQDGCQWVWEDLS